MTDTDNRTRIAVAGATGFVGRHIPSGFGRPAELVALTREPRRIAGPDSGGDLGYATWRRCDLFSRLETFQALEDVDVVVYAVHAAQPSTRLSQGDVGDLEVLCADNVARAAHEHDLEHIVQIDGPLADTPDSPEVLAHRREVYETLSASGVPVTGLRTNFIVGPGSITTGILAGLIRRLPVVALPLWADIPTRPIGIDDLTELVGGVAGRPATFEGNHRVGGRETVSFRQMLRKTARVMERRRWFPASALDTFRGSSALIRLVSEAPSIRIRRLIASLRAGRDTDLPETYPLQAHLDQTPDTFSAALSRALTPGGEARLEGRASRALDTADSALPSTDARPESRPARVRSVQRMPLPAGKHADWVGDYYPDFLVDLMHPVLTVEVDSDRRVRIFFRPLRRPLLELQLDADVSRPDRALYWVTGGLLASTHGRGRFEFREILGGRYVIVGLHEFEPALPWPLYRLSQAWFHRWVMSRFGARLAELDSNTRGD